MASVKKHLPILKLVKSAKPKLRKSIILHCDLDLIRTIDDCIHNTLHGNIPVKYGDKVKLKKFKSVLRKVSKSKGGLAKKRKIIVQHGGSFLPLLLGPIIAAADAIFRG